MSHIPRDPWPGQSHPKPFLSAEHRAFCLARQAMHARFLEWLGTGPTAEDVDAEMAPVPDVLQQLRSIMQVQR